MMGRGEILRKYVLPLLAASVLALAFVAVAGAATVTPVASGLDNPRGVAFLPNGTLAVAEAGHGGDVCLGSGGTLPCLGTSSQISAIDLATGSHSPIVSGLFSVKEPEGGGSVIGAAGLSVQGGRLLASMGESPAPLAGVSCTGLASDCPAVLATARAEAGQLLKVTPSGSWKALAGVGLFDYNFTAANPGDGTYGDEVDANPYGVLAMPSGTYVADAGANTLDWVGNNGDISILHRFVVPNPPEPFPTDGVPTCIAQGAGGLIVADLAGRIWSVDGTNATLLSGQVAARHFTGCTADGAGNVYLVSMFSGLFPNPGTGSVVELAANSSGSVSTIASGLVFPNMITIGPDGQLYVSVNSVCGATAGPPCGPLTGGVVKITQ
jgi:hypothetical protein